jgi:hypothetical protein
MRQQRCTARPRGLQQAAASCFGTVPAQVHGSIVVRVSSLLACIAQACAVQLRSFQSVLKTSPPSLLLLHYIVAGTDHRGASSGSTPAARASAGGSPASSRLSSDRMMYITQSVAPPATRHLSGPAMDPNWEFDRGKAVRVLLQVCAEGFLSAADCSMSCFYYVAVYTSVLMPCVSSTMQHVLPS